MVNPMDLAGKQILITGASSGIGRDTAILLSKLGAKVILVSRDIKKLQDTLKVLEKREHKIYQFDLSNIDGIEELVKIVISENGSLNGLVYSAGKRIIKPLNMLKINFLEDMMKVNLYAFIELVRCLSKRSNYVEGMSIVGLSSVASDVGDKGNVAYCTSKAAMDGAIRAMAKELSHKKIRINTIKPGFIQTDMYLEYVNAVGEVTANSTICNRQYLGLGQTNDIAYMVAYLLSDVSRFITGTAVVVDGGYLS